jgi:hypothetical protein
VLGSLLCEGNVEVMGLWSWGLSHKANSVGKASWPRHRAALQSRRAAVWQRLEGANRWGSRRDCEWPNMWDRWEESI